MEQNIKEMRRSLLASAICIMMLCVAWNYAPDLKNAVASWSLSDINDGTDLNSKLTVHGDVKFISLTPDEEKASKARGGDGVAAQFNGGWLDAGQGINDELNLTGKNISILVRVKPDAVKGFTPIAGKAGNDQSIAYGISFDKIDDDIYIETKMGSDDIGGAHVLKYKVPKNEVHQWHDILLRFNGKLSQLYVDGSLRDDEVTVGEIRDWNRRPLLIGAEYKNAGGYSAASGDSLEAVFKGLIDHVVLWNRYLADEEVKQLSGVTELKDGRPVYYNEKYRPQFHFSAKKNWINDPNGLVYYDGVYHLFFQYMPPNRPGAYKDWGQAVSNDLVHWQQVPEHITPHKVWAGCWTGSAVVDFNNSAGFQTGDKKAIIAMLTNGGNPAYGRGPMCTQNIAYSNDGGTTFTYYDQNPVIRTVNKENRDPKVVWDEVSKKWIMSMYMDKGNDFGLYASSNLKDWQYLSTASIDGVTECPGFEPLPVDGNPANKKWLFSGANGDYVIGSFDGINFKSETEVLRGDYGMNYYAAQIWNNTPGGKCISIAWMPTQRYPDMPFEQQMNFPTEVTLRTTAQGIKAFRMPVTDIKNLYDKGYTWANKNKKESNLLFNKLNGDLYDMDIEIDVQKSTSFQIGLRNVSLIYDVATGVLSCGGEPMRNGIVPTSKISSNEWDINMTNSLGKAPLKPVNGKIKLRILLDRNTIEVFGNDGEIALSSCFMPKDGDHAYSFKSAGEIIVSAKVYALKSMWVK